MIKFAIFFREKKRAQICSEKSAGMRMRGLLRYEILTTSCAKGTLHLDKNEHG